MSDSTPSPDIHPEQEEHDPRQGFFVIGEFMLHIEHLADAKLLAWVASLWETLGLADYSYEAEAVSITSLANEDQLTSLIKIPISAFLAEDTDEIPQLQPKDAALIGLFNLFKQKNELPFIHEGIILKAFTPNWMFSSMGHSIAHPSPGGRPAHVLDGAIPDEAANEVDVDASAAIDAAVAKNPRLSKRGVSSYPVNVVILDTAPPQDEDQLLELCNTTFPHQFRLRSLLENNQLHIIHAAGNGITLPAIPGEDPNHYTIKTEDNVSDHGLFIAGIVHQFAPEANIYIVEVLNQYGIGTIESIVQGIRLVTDTSNVIAYKNIPVIVNCSFSIGFLSVEELNAQLAEQGLPALNITDVDFQTMRELEMLKVALRRFDVTFTQARIFAAAGNDAPDVDPPTPPPAYVPAAFDFVQGVGATNGAGERAWYSNLSDIPPVDGVLVYGGGMVQNGDVNETDPGDGVLSIYVGAFPDGNPNENGWAYWSGTSFATGRMSGMFANAATVGRNISPNASHDLYADFKAQSVGTTGDGEEILPGI